MEKVQHITRAAIRRASIMEVPQQAKQNMQELFVNFCLILICLLLIYIIVLLMWAGGATGFPLANEGEGLYIGANRIEGWDRRPGLFIILSSCMI